MRGKKLNQDLFLRVSTNISQQPFHFQNPHQVQEVLLLHQAFVYHKTLLYHQAHHSQQQLLCLQITAPQISPNQHVSHNHRVLNNKIPPSHHTPVHQALQRIENVIFTQKPCHAAPNLPQTPVTKVQRR